MQTIYKADRILVIFVSLFLFNACSAKEHNFKAGYDLEVILTGARHSSMVPEVKPELYTIDYNSQANSFNTWITDDQIHASKEKTYQNLFNHATGIAIKTAEFNEDLPEIVGTSWSLLCIYEKGTQPKYLHNFPEYLFCKNGRWELHSLTNSAGQMGTYTIKGNQLKTIHDGKDKLTENYTITWNAAEKYLELNDGKQIFRLRYRTKTKC